MSEISKPSELVDELAEAADRRQETIEMAKDYADATLEEPTGHSRAPRSIAAGAIYLASLLTNDKITQHELSDAVDVSQTTIRLAYRDVARAVDARRDGPPRFESVYRTDSADDEAKSDGLSAWMIAKLRPLLTLGFRVGLALGGALLYIIVFPSFVAWPETAALGEPLREASEVVVDVTPFVFLGFIISLIIGLMLDVAVRSWRSVP